MKDLLVSEPNSSFGIRHSSGRGFEGAVEPVGSPRDQERDRFTRLVQRDFERLFRLVVFHEVQRGLQNNGRWIQRRGASARDQQRPVLLLVRTREESVFAGLQSLVLAEMQ